MAGAINGLLLPGALSVMLISVHKTSIFQDYTSSVDFAGCRMDSSCLDELDGV